MTDPIQRVAVVGAGSWGTTFAKVVADAGRDVTLWCRREAVAAEIRRSRINAAYLPDIRLPDGLRATADLTVALDGADAIVLAVPSQSLRENLVVLRDLLGGSAPVVSLAKGVEVGTGLRMSELIEQVGRVPRERIVVLTGPNLAKEIAAGQPTAAVVACRDHGRAVAVQHGCATDYFRPFTSTDVIGAEIAGTGKNVIALACGIADGLGFGGNTSASLIARGLAEMTRLGCALGARESTFAGLAGIGDLVATASSGLSRNRALGYRLGTGMSLEAALDAASGQVAEGVANCRSVRSLAGQHDVPVPITEGVYRVCYQHTPPQEMIRMLMSGPQTSE